MYSNFALQTKVHWSKNVLEERDCPEQIFLGSNDHDYCLLLALSLYLEIYVTTNTNSVYLFGEGDESEKTVNKIRNTYSNSIRKFFVNYLAAYANVLGTHSFRKYAATWARNNGSSEDDVNNRGRWKRTRRVVNRYLDVEQEYVDAKVQASLCVGGAVRYKLVDGSGVTSAWCDEYVVPGIKRHFGVSNTISDVLALPLLYLCLNDDLVHTVPDTIASRVRDAYATIRVLDVDVNPVKKVKLIVDRLEDRLVITEEGNDVDADGNHRQQQQQNTNSVLSSLQQFKQQVATQFDIMQQSFTNLRSDITVKHSIIQKNINRIFIQPPRQGTRQQQQEREQNDNLAQAVVLFNYERQPLIAELSKTPRTIFDLWTEYQTGSGGRKAAKDFTFTERGKCKFKYCRRKVVWDCIVKHVNAGHFAEVAIDKIYQCYGQSSNVSFIINAMVQDKKTGGHPNLRI